MAPTKYSSRGQVTLDWLSPAPGPPLVDLAAPFAARLGNVLKKKIFSCMMGLNYIHAHQSPNGLYTHPMATFNLDIVRQNLCLRKISRTKTRHNSRQETYRHTFS